jgi:hypothetical protein
MVTNPGKAGAFFMERESIRECGWAGEWRAGEYFLPLAGFIRLY